MCYLSRKAKTPKKLAQVCNTPTRLNSWLSFFRPFRGIRYVKFPKQEYHTPEETLATRKGDCKAISWLAMATMDEMEKCYNPFLLAVYSRSRDEGHMVCFFSLNGEAYYISSDGMKYCGTMQGATLATLASKVFSDWKKATLYEPTKDGTSLRAVKAVYPGVDL